jgi:hypothetical protein
MSTLIKLPSTRVGPLLAIDLYSLDSIIQFESKKDDHEIALLADLALILKLNWGCSYVHSINMRQIPLGLFRKGPKHKPMSLPQPN